MSFLFVLFTIYAVSHCCKAGRHHCAIHDGHNKASRWPYNEKSIVVKWISWETWIWNTARVPIHLTGQQWRQQQQQRHGGSGGAVLRRSLATSSISRWRTVWHVGLADVKACRHVRPPLAAHDCPPVTSCVRNNPRQSTPLANKNPSSSVLCSLPIEVASIYERDRWSWWEMSMQ